jgi:hypothetical protein
MIRSLTTTKGPEENVDTNVTATTNVFAPTCRKRNHGGLRSSSRFLLKFHVFKLDANSAVRIRRRGIQRSVWTSLRGSIGHSR